MREDALHGAELLATAAPDVICYIATAACFVLGVAGEKALLKAMEDKTGIKAASGGSSVTEAFKFLGVKKMSMYVPTNAEITAKSTKYFEDQGLEVCACESLGQESLPNINRISPWEIYGDVIRLYRRCPEVDGIFVTGGCFRMLEILETLEKDTGVPIVTTTPANMWRCLQLVGVKDPIYGFGQLLQKPR
jgi:maleate cis-trans isomerase